MAELRKYAIGSTIFFPLIDRGTADFDATPVTFAAGDVQISKDSGGFANTTNLPVHLGKGIYTLALTLTELTAAKVVVIVIDTAPKDWEDQAVYIETYGNASAEHAFDLDTATVVASNLTDKTGMALTAAEHTAIADEIWDELRAGHVIAGSFGQGAASVQGNITGSVASVSGNVDGNVSGSVVGTIGDLAAAAKTSVNAEVDTALADINLDHFIDIAGTVNDVTPAANNFDTDLVSAVDSFHIGRRLKFITGALAGQERRIAAYAGGTKNVILGAAYTSVPANGDAFVLLPSVEGALTAAGIWDELEGAEPSAVIVGNASMRVIMQTIKRRFFNKATQTASLFTQYRDDSTTVLHNQVTSFDGTTQSKSRAS